MCIRDRALAMPRRPCGLTACNPLCGHVCPHYGHGIAATVSVKRGRTTVVARASSARRAGHELHSCTVTAQSTGDARAVAVGVVLAGGEARRMGRDKRLLRLAGVTLLERNLAFLSGIFPTVGLSLRDTRQLSGSLPPSVEIVPDVVTGPRKRARTE